MRSTDGMVAPSRSGGSTTLSVTGKGRGVGGDSTILAGVQSGWRLNSEQGCQWNNQSRRISNELADAAWGSWVNFDCSGWKTCRTNRIFPA